MAIDYQAMLYAALALGSGLPMLLRPRGHWRRAHGAWERRRAELGAGAAERFFEEGRSLQAYPPPASPRRTQWLGAGPTLGGLVLAGLAVFR